MTKLHFTGLIAYYGLAKWWQGAFTERQRRLIIDAYGKRLAWGDVDYHDETKAYFLWKLAKAVERDGHLQLAARIRRKARNFWPTDRL